MEQFISVIEAIVEWFKSGGWTAVISTPTAIAVIGLVAKIYMTKRSLKRQERQRQMSAEEAAASEQADRLHEKIARRIIKHI